MLLHPRLKLQGSLAQTPCFVAAGVASSWGPAHGGANESVISMLKTIGKEENIDKAYLKKPKI